MAKKKKKTLEEVLNDDTMSEKDKYEWYINKSDEWKEIREIVLSRDEYKCQVCNRTEKLSVHHKTYKHLYDEKNHLEDLIVLCSVCHRAIHFAKSNRKIFRKDETKK